MFAAPLTPVERVRALSKVLPPALAAWAEQEAGVTA